MASSSTLSYSRQSGASQVDASVASTSTARRGPKPPVNPMWRRCHVFSKDLHVAQVLRIQVPPAGHPRYVAVNGAGDKSDDSDSDQSEATSGLRDMHGSVASASSLVDDADSDDDDSSSCISSVAESSLFDVADRRFSRAGTTTPESTVEDLPDTPTPLALYFPSSPSAGAHSPNDLIPTIPSLPSTPGIHTSRRVSHASYINYHNDFEPVYIPSHRVRMLPPKDGAESKLNPMSKCNLNKPLPPLPVAVHTTRDARSISSDDCTRQAVIPEELELDSAVLEVLRLGNTTRLHSGWLACPRRECSGVCREPEALTFHIRDHYAKILASHKLML